MNGVNDNIMRVFIYLAIFFFVIACKNSRSIDSLQTNIDTSINSNKPSSLDQINNLFYPVYELSKRTTAVVINFADTDEWTIFDSIFHQISLTDSLDYSLLESPKKCYYFDTTGVYKLLKSEKLEKEIKKHFEEEIYIYGTKGVIKAKIRNVLFGLHDCRTNIFALCIDNIDQSTIGHPVIGSKQLFNLKFDEQYETIENSIQKMYANEISDYDYLDSTATKVFAHTDFFYFSYSDDFLWGQNSALSNCLFPSRAIFVLKQDGSLKSYWADGLDLFGIPCD